MGALQHQVSTCRRDADTIVGWGRLLSQIQAEVGADKTPAQETDENRAGENKEVSENKEDQWGTLLSLLHRVPPLAEVPQVCDTRVSESRKPPHLMSSAGFQSRGGNEIRQKAGDDVANSTGIR